MKIAGAIAAGAMYPSLSDQAGAITDAAFRDLPRPVVDRGPIDIGAKPHQWVYADDEYGSLADGGSYEVWKCSVCGATKHVPLPD